MRASLPAGPRYQAGTGCQAAICGGATQFGDPFAPRLAVSRTGQVIALWNSFIYVGRPYRSDVWSSFLASPSGTWSTQALIENNDRP